MITPAQTRMIHTAKRALGLSDDDYRDMLEERFRVRSSSDLTSNQARIFIDELMLKGFESAGAKIDKNVGAGFKPARKGKNVINLPSRAQLDYIRDLKAKIGWKAEDGFERWLKVMFGLDKIRTGKDAQRVIEGLKGLLKHGHGVAATNKDKMEAAV